MFQSGESATAQRKRRTARDTVVMVSGWSASDPGVLLLPSGRLVRGRGLRRPMPDGLVPDFGIYLLDEAPRAMPWDARWVRWPDFRLPADRGDAWEALSEAWCRAVAERVEVACGGGRGRTGTALAGMALLDGVPAHDAVAYVREHYHPRAVETPWQRRYVAGSGGRGRAVQGTACCTGPVAGSALTSPPRAAAPAVRSRLVVDDREAPALEVSEALTHRP